MSKRAVRVSPRIGVPSTRFHAWLHRVSGGRIGNTFISQRAPVLFLVTVGRKTGKRRETPLVYTRDGERFVVAASNAGAAPQPALLGNLLAAGEAAIRVERETIQVSPRIAEGAERLDLWRRLGEVYDGYDSYQAQAERQIPVVVLEPKHPGGDARSAQGPHL
jgi:deazaflavin-dependent oxidoreductase (nitroreductase family)